MSKEILERLLNFPLRSQIKISFNMREKFFEFSLPIYSTRKEMPLCLKRYVAVRQGRSFQPHQTFFQQEDKKIILTQKVPFSLQSSLREQVDQFWQMAKRCHQMCSEMAIEELYKDALYLDGI